MSEGKKQIGRILLKRRLISQDALERELEKQAAARDGVPLASRLSESGVIGEMDALRALSEQFGVPGIDLNQIAIPTAHLELVPRDVAESNQIFPVLVRDDRVFLAMANPRDKRAIDEIEFVTGRKVYPYVAITTTLERTIFAAYEAKGLGQSYYAGPNAPAEAVARLGGPQPAEQRKERDSVAPGAPSVVVDEAIEEAAAEDDISTTDFGQLGAEVSRVEMLPDELRAGSAFEPAPTSSRSGKTVLVVDDEQEIRKLVRRLLAEKGHRILEADRGLVALRMVKENMPDLILLDAMLPELHGFDIARRIKGSEKYGNIPILMMSAVYRGWRIAEDLKANYRVEAYVEKPFRISDLVSKVDHLLERGAAGPPSRDPEQMNRDAARFLEDGIAAYKNGEVELAMALLKRGIAVDPLAYRLRYHLALIYGKHGQLYDGITELERAVDLNPKHFAALKNLAVLYEKAGFRHKAAEMWERCVHAAPDDEIRESIKAHLLKLL